MSKPRKNVKSEIQHELKKDQADSKSIAANLNVEERPTRFEKVSKRDEKKIGLQKKAKLAKHEEKLKKPYIGRKDQLFSKKERDLIESEDDAESEDENDVLKSSKDKPKIDNDPTHPREPEDRLCQNKKNKKVCD